MLLDLRRRRKPGLFQSRGRLGDLHRWRLQGKRFGLGEGLVLARVLGVFLGEVFAFLRDVDVVVVVEVGAEGGGHGGLGEAGRVGCGLRAELGEVEV